VALWHVGGTGEQGVGGRKEREECMYSKGWSNALNKNKKKTKKKRKKKKKKKKKKEEIGKKIRLGKVKVMGRCKGGGKKAKRNNPGGF